MPARRRCAWGRTRWTSPRRATRWNSLGAQASIARNVQVSAQLVGTAGGKERGYGGMLNLSYRW